MVQLHVHAGGDLLGQIIVGRYDNIETRATGQQFSVQYVIGVIHIVGHLNAGFFLEIGNGVFCDVVRPVVNIQLAVSLSRRHATYEGGSGQGH